ncbi:hypothetical protein IV79_GL000435 [Pediococcus claussenii]|nr:hypothetical protein IV79_GL000435 [Pediococcus claussenii]
MGGIIGVIAGAVTSKNVPGSWLGNIVAGLIGSWLGQTMLGSWGPYLAGIALVPSILGAVILVLVASFFLSRSAKNR